MEKHEFLKVIYIIILGFTLSFIASCSFLYIFPDFVLQSSVYLYLNQINLTEISHFLFSYCFLVFISTYINSSLIIPSFLFFSRCIDLAAAISLFIILLGGIAFMIKTSRVVFFN